MVLTQEYIKEKVVKDFTREEVLGDYRLVFQSRQASLLGRKEVLTGKAKFGIFGDGKELPQIALAKYFRPGDFRSGYYRDQTWMFANGMSSIQEFFAQLYAHTDVDAEPSSAGRSMNGHFSTRSLNPDGTWRNLTLQFNSSSDISPTGSQMPRLVGLAYASKLYREIKSLHSLNQFSNNGNEVVFATIGNASCAEGMFFEAVNAIGVLQAPAIISIWDDGYGISVPNEYQMTKNSVSEVLKGLQREEDKPGYDIYVVRAWDYETLCKTYQMAVEQARKFHIPAIIHVIETTQPQGHSTSGSHERYKSKERLAWEREFDCVKKMREWIIQQDFATAEELDTFETEDKQIVNNYKKAAWSSYLAPIKQEITEISAILQEVGSELTQHQNLCNSLANELQKTSEPFRRDIFVAIRKVLTATTQNHQSNSRKRLLSWYKDQRKANFERYSSYLYSETADSVLKIPTIPAEYHPDSPQVDGREILQACFDAALKRDSRVLAFGEDVGYLGDVNQAFAGLQEKYGVYRVSDTGIREVTIVGQGIGLAMRGLRPIAEIQYLDYLLYALQIMSDDLATVQYRTKGGQKAPLIVRTRGHRLEGIWHAGSPLGTIINALRGIHVLVPRNMTQAAGFYNTLLQAEEPALIIEVLNGYRQKETLPDNIGEFTVPLGVPETLRQGTDITLVTYGANCRIALEAAEILQQMKISVEIIDIQTLIPFDINHQIVKSLQKTNRIVVLDEDVRGGASAYILQQILEDQQGYRWLDSQPITITSQDHRPAYGSDGDYFSKPNIEDIIINLYKMMHEFNPNLYPDIF